MAPSHALPSDRLVGGTRSYCPSTNDSLQGRVKGKLWLLLAPDPAQQLRTLLQREFTGVCTAAVERAMNTLKSWG
jgi:hypothetical protein